MADRVREWIERRLRRTDGVAFPAILLVAANLVPLWGVLSSGWRVFDIVALYWFENVIVGGINVLKIAASAAPLRDSGSRTGAHEHVDGDRDDDGIATLKNHLSKLFLVPFFLFHYGLFTMVHGVFVVLTLGPGSGQLAPGISSFRNDDALHYLQDAILSGPLTFGAVSLAFSHFISFLYHYIAKGEFRRATAVEQMVAPYSRVVVLHLAILGGGFAVFALGSHLALLAVLIAGKTALDLGLHIRSHRAASA